MSTYEIRPGVAEQSRVRAYELRQGDPAVRPLRVYAVDPSVSKSDGATVVLRVPYEPLTPGPTGFLFEVECRDGDTQLAPLDLEDPRILIQSGIAPSIGSAAFHQQMVYAVASSVYATFREALGRLIAWAFDEDSKTRTGRLILRPHVSAECGNAAYDRTRREIRFGYVEDPRMPGAGRVFACLSHDIIAHEMTHALIDGLRSRFTIPTNPDVLGLHEGLADLVALFHRFLQKEVVTGQIRRVGASVGNSPLLTELAAEFTKAAMPNGGGRSAVAPDGGKQIYRSDMEAHEMGAVLVSAIFDAFVNIFRRKTERYVRLAGPRAEGFLPEELIQILADQATALARQFLNICIRAIDYCPPVDVELGDYLRALLTADYNLVRDDPWGYRETIIRSFAEHGIFPRDVLAMSEDVLLWRGPSRRFLRIERLSFSSLRFNGDPSVPASAEELNRQAAALGDYLMASTDIAEFGLMAPDGLVDPPAIQSIRTSRRLGPDGQVLFDLIAEVTQRRMVIDESSGVKTKFMGGSTLVIGPRGEIRFVISKGIDNAPRMARQLKHQMNSRMWKAESDGQYHLTGAPFQLIHRQ